MFPSVYIGIVTFNSSEDILLCLKQIIKQTFPKIKIIIFDNNSQDNTCQLIKKNHNTVKVILSKKNVGFGNAHNYIINQIQFKKNDYYLPLNPDVLLSSIYVTELIYTLKKTNSDWATGKLLSSINKNIIYSVGHGIRKDGYVFNIGHGMIDEGCYEEQREIFGAPGAASLWKYAAIQKVVEGNDFFDSNMFMYGEDTDLDWRARNIGLRCFYSPKAIAYHRGSKPDKYLSLHSVRNRYISVIKNADTFDLFFYNIPIIIFHCMFRVLHDYKSGLWLTHELIMSLPLAFKKRKKKEKFLLLKWINWSKKEKTLQPRGYLERYQSYKHKFKFL